MTSPVWHLLKRNISAGQLLGYAIANLVGLSIVLTAIQFYSDVSSATDADDSFISRDYLILSRKVSGLGSLLGSSSRGFSQEDITDLEQQPWVRRLAPFTSSAFDVSASVEMAGAHLNTALFLESIPNDYLDITPAQWSYTPGANNPVPVIISRDYLTLYNFGYAASRGLPQVTESMIGMVPLRLSLSGNGKQAYVPARIVGFSSRLNTFAVPEEFMTWANSEFSDHPADAPSRLIVEVNNPGHPDIQEYLKAHGLETAGDKLDNGRAAYFLRIVTAVVIAVGAVISLLALFILLLSIYLLLQKNRRKLHDLMTLGYRPSQVARHYYAIVACINSAILFLAIIVILIASSLWHAPLEAIGVVPSAPWPAIIVGIVLTIVITAINIIAITRKVQSTFPSPHNQH